MNSIETRLYFCLVAHSENRFTPFGIWSVDGPARFFAFLPCSAGQAEQEIRKTPPVWAGGVLLYCAGAAAGLSAGLT